MEHGSNASRPYCPAAAAGNSGGPPDTLSFTPDTLSFTPDTLSFDPIHSCRWVLKQLRLHRWGKGGPAEPARLLCGKGQHRRTRGIHSHSR